jgi:hypothetical protein
VIQTLLDYYRTSTDALGGVSAVADLASADVGFFRFGTNNICYGRNLSGAAADVSNAWKFDASKDIRYEGKTIHLPFDFTEVIDNLRMERYRQKMVPGRESFATSKWVRKPYYLIRELLPLAIRRRLQRVYFRDWKELPFPSWPVDFTVDNLHQHFLQLLMETNGLARVPFIWFWPEGAPNCLMMTHDVETSSGRDFTPKLMDLDDSYAIKASFQVIPEKRYDVPEQYINQIRSRGFEFNIHDLNHDGNLYRERSEFTRRAKRVNGYVRRYNARGFRAGAMYRNQDWYDAFEFSFDMSVPNVAHLEPMRGGCCTVMPFFIGKILELPLTATQDYSLFHILNEYSIDLWKQQLALLRERNGLMSFITHPDYLIDRRALKVYESLLDYLRQIIVRDGIWVAHPGDIDEWWRARNQMRLVHRGDGWEIDGPQNERARVAYAVLDGGRLVYEVEGTSSLKSAVR